MHRLAALLLLSAAPPYLLPEGSATIVVTVANVRSDRGQVRCSLFATREGFPGPSPLDRGQIDVAAARGAVTCTFERVPAGEFAVSAIHDEDGDGSLDTNFLGIPREGYGASNNLLPARAAPVFETSRFTVGVGERVNRSITLKY